MKRNAYAFDFMRSRLAALQNGAAGFDGNGKNVAIFFF